MGSIVLALYLLLMVPSCLSAFAHGQGQMNSCYLQISRSLLLKDRRGEWEPIKIPPWNLTYIPKLPQIHSTKSRRATLQNLNHNSTSLSSSLAQQKHELEQVSISKKFPSSSVDSTKQNGNSSPLHTSKHKVENPTRTAAQPQWKRIRGAAHGPRTGV